MVRARLPTGVGPHEPDPGLGVGGLLVADGDQHVERAGVLAPDAEFDAIDGHPLGPVATPVSEGHDRAEDVGPVGDGLPVPLRADACAS